MSNNIKLGLYVVATILACLFGYFTYTSYSRLMDTSADASPTTSLDLPSVERKPGTKGYARFLTFGSLFFVSILGLGLLVGTDVSHLLGSKVVKVLYNDEGEGLKSPDYDHAEQTWADGNYLEAITLMRDYLKKNPREQHVAIRIAEIYEKDLNNNLAAALEYEDVLTQKLPAERWGWSAIHLCNLYFRLGQPEKAISLLRRIDAEYPKTAAAQKARKRLELIDSGRDSGELIENSGQVGGEQTS